MTSHLLLSWYAIDNQISGVNVSHIILILNRLMLVKKAWSCLNRPNQFILEKTRPLSVIKIIHCPRGLLLDYPKYCIQLLYRFCYQKSHYQKSHFIHSYPAAIFDRIYIS